MTPDTLFKDLSHISGQITLRKDTAGIAHLGHWIKPILGRTGALVVYNPKRVLGSRQDTLAIGGHAEICGVACDIHLRFILSGHEVIGFSLLAMLPSNWRLTQSFPYLSRKHGVGIFNKMRFETPVLVLAANCGPISELDLGLDAVNFENGLNLYAKGLKSPGLATLADFSQIGSARPTHAGQPDLIKMHINPDPDGADLDVSIWWPEVGEDSTDTITGARILRAGWRHTCSGIGGEGDDLTEATSWLWKLRAATDEPPFDMITTPGAKAGAPPTHVCVFPAARLLTGGAQGLAAYADGDDLSDHMPIGIAGDDIDLALASSEITPGERATYNLVATDAATGGAYAWDLVPGHLVLEDMNISIHRDLTKNGGVSGSIRGTADLGGYEFTLLVDAAPRSAPPINSVRGFLNKPHDVDVGDLLEDLYGHPTGLPGLNVKLLDASYSQDFRTQTMSVNMEVGGHIDLTSTGLLMLEQVGFSYETQNGQATRKEVRGKIDLFGMPIAMRAEQDREGEWLFEGRADPVHAVHVDAVAGELLERFNLPVPMSLPDIEISEFGVGYYSTSKNIHVWGRADWTPSDKLGLPWEIGKIHMVVDFFSERDQETGQRSSTLELNWLYAPKPASQFDATVRFEPDMVSVYADWLAPSDTARIGLNQLAKDLSIDHMMALPDLSTWPLFSLFEASMGFQTHPPQVAAAVSSDFAGGIMHISVQSGEVAGLLGTWQPKPTGKGKPPATLGLNNVLSAIGATFDLDTTVQIPSEMFDFTSLSMEVTHAPIPAFTFTGASAHADYREVFISAIRQGKGWGFVTGVTFDGDQDLGDMSLFRDTLGNTLSDIVNSVLPFEPSFVLYSTMGLKHFVPPVSGVHTRAVMPNQPDAGQALASSVMQSAARDQNYHLVPGVTVAGRLVLSDGIEPMMMLAHNIIGVDTLEATLTLSDTPAIMARIPGQVEIPTIDGHHLVLRAPYFGVEFGKGEPAYTVGGDLTLSLFGDVREVDVALYFSPEMISASVALQNIPLPPIQGLPGVRIDHDFIVQMAVGLEPPGFDLGLQGSFKIGTGDDYAGDMTIVMDMAEGVANPRYVRFTIETLSFWGIFEAVTGLETLGTAAKDGLDAAAAGSAAGNALGGFIDAYENLKPIFEEISLTDVAFHWAEVPLILPDGSSVMPGSSFKGMLHLFGFELYGAFNFATGVSTQFNAILEMEPIHLGPVLKVTGDGKGLKQSEIAPVVSGREQLGNTSPKHDQSYVLEPGGPVFIVNSRRSPFLHASLHVELFGISHTDVTADADMHGVTFHLTTELASIVDLKIDATLTREDGKFRFHSEGDLSVHLDASFSIPLPDPIPDLPIEIDGGFEADVTIEAIDGEITMTIEGSLDFEGADLPIPKLVLHEHMAHLDDLKDHLIKHIIGNAGDIFVDLISHLDDVGKLADAAVNLAIDQAEAKVKLAADTATKAADIATHGAKQALDAASGEVEQATETLNQATTAIDTAVTQQVDALEEKTKEATDKIAGASRAAVHAAASVADTITGGALKKFPFLENMATTVVGDTIAAVADIAIFAEQAIGDLVHEATVIFNSVLKNMAETVKALSEAADLIFNQLNAGFHWIAGKFVDGANIIGKGFHEAWDWTKNAAGAVVDEISSWFT